MADIQSFSLHVNDQRVRVWRGGRGRSLILLHAGGGDAQVCWELLWNELSDDFDIVAPDWPGFGESAAMVRTTWADLAGWIESLRRSLGLEKVSFAGNSFGGTMALLYAGEFPAHVDRLVLINGGGFPEAGATNPALAAILSSGQFSGPEDFARATHKLMFHDQNLLTPEFQARLSAGTATIFSILQQAMSGPRPEPKRVNAPTLVLWGERDRYVPAAAGRAVAEGVAGARFKLVPAAGHMPQIEQPRAVLDAMREFLR